MQEFILWLNAGVCLAQLKTFYGTITSRYFFLHFQQSCRICGCQSCLGFSLAEVWVFLCLFSRGGNRCSCSSPSSSVCEGIHLLIANSLKHQPDPSHLQCGLVCSWFCCTVKYAILRFVHEQWKTGCTVPSFFFQSTDRLLSVPVACIAVTDRSHRVFVMPLSSC